MCQGNRSCKHAFERPFYLSTHRRSLRLKFLVVEAEEGVLHVMLEQRNEEHNADPGGHAQDLETKLR